MKGSWKQARNAAKKKSEGTIKTALAINKYLNDVSAEVVLLREQSRRLLLQPPHAVVGPRGNDERLSVNHLPGLVLVVALGVDRGTHVRCAVFARALYIFLRFMCAQSRASSRGVLWCTLLLLVILICPVSKLCQGNDALQRCESTSYHTPNLLTLCLSFFVSASSYLSTLWYDSTIDTTDHCTRAHSLTM